MFADPEAMIPQRLAVTGQLDGLPDRDILAHPPHGGRLVENGKTQRRRHLIGGRGSRDSPGSSLNA